MPLYRYTAEVEQEIRRLYEEKVSVREIVERFGGSRKAVHNCLDRNGVQRQKGGQGLRTWKPEQEVEVVRLYEEGLPISEIIRRLGGSKYAVLRCIKRHGVTPRSQQRPLRRFSDSQVDEMARLWSEEGLSQSAIAQRFGTTQIAVSRQLRTRQIEPHVRWNVAYGERHGSWKGGRTLTQQGYVLVYVPADSPFASMRTNTGYVLEHRLAMAQLLGRPLSRNETVHHLNGDHTDNRPENLQLRHGRHGKGIVFMCADCGSHNVVSSPLD